MKECAYCGRENGDDAAVCHECGTDEFKNTAIREQKEEPFTNKLEFIPLTPEDRQNDFATLVRCRTLLDAHLIVAQLESIGISAFIPDEFLMQAVSFNLNTYGYVRVQVPTRDYEEAKEFLSAANDGEPD